MNRSSALDHSQNEEQLVVDPLGRDSAQSLAVRLNPGDSLFIDGTAESGAEAKGTKARIISVAPGGMDTPFWSEQRSDFMDPKEIAAIVVDAISRPVTVSEIVISRA